MSTHSFLRFHPFLPAWILLVVGLLVLVARGFTLWRLFAARGAGVRQRWGRWTAITLALVAVVVAGLGPALGGREVVKAGADVKKEVSASSDNLNVYLVIDRSLASLARDQGSGQDQSTRINSIRLDSADLAQKFPKAQFSMISWGRAADVEWPLSPDVSTLASTLEGLPAYDVPETVSSATSGDYVFVDRGAAAAPLKRMLEYQRENYPDRANVVVYFGCGETGSGRPQSSFADVAPLVDGAVVLGYGTAAGGPVLLSHADGTVAAVGGREGSPDRIGYDEGVMRQVAGELGAAYLHRTSGSAKGEVLAALGATVKPRPELHVSVPGFPLYWALLLITAVVGAVECYPAIRTQRRARWTASAVKRGVA